MTSRSFFRTKLTASIAMTALLGAFVAPPSLQATSHSVWWVAASGTAPNQASDGTSCLNPSYVGNSNSSIQAAISGATAGDEIRICSGDYAISSTVTVDRDITITGVGELLPVLDGGSTTRIMAIDAGLTVSLSGLHIRNGRITGGENPGAGIQVNPTSTVTIEDSLFVNNIAQWHGGAISMTGDGPGRLDVMRSTFYKNRAEDGGAILVVGGGLSAHASDSTFVANVATREGGAMGGSFSDVSVSSSTFIDNTAASSGSAIYNVATQGNIFAHSSDSTVQLCAGDRSHGANVSTDLSCLTDPQESVTYASLGLSFLGMWGGRTPTVPISADSSAAVDAITASEDCSTNDQHGTPRTQPCDAGAVEYRPNQPTIQSSVASTALIRNRPIPTITFSSAELTAPVVYRISTELNPLNGISMSPSGVLTGTPISTFGDQYFVVTGTDTNGVTASGRFRAENCILTMRNDTYLISDAGDLDLFRLGLCGMDNNFEQTANIEWSGPWSGPVSSFTGTYDGGEHSITGLQISGGRTSFIPRTDGAMISNLSFSATVIGSYASAGLVSAANSTTIDNVHGSGTVSTPLDDPSQGCIGGLVGETDFGTIIRNSSFVGTIDAANGSWNGGLIGCAYAGTILEKSYFNGSVTGIDEIGGLIGWMSETDVRNSYATGAVSITGSKLGGLVGWHEYDNTEDDNTFAIENSYASMQLSGTDRVGGMLGYGKSTSISASFWESGLTGTSGLNPIGELSDLNGSQPDLSGLSAATFKSHGFFTDAGWSIGNGWADASERSTVWAMCDEEDRPFLLWQYSTTLCEQFVDPTPEPNSPPTDTPAPPSSGPTPSDTPAPVTRTPAAPASDSVSTSDATSQTPATIPATAVAPPATPLSTETSLVDNTPKLTVGGLAIFSGGKKIENSLKWSGKSAVTGLIGNVTFTANFTTNTVQLNSRANVTAGSTFKLSLKNLKPRSKVSVTLYSQPTTIGLYKTSTVGTINELVKVPSDIAPGNHRVRVEILDQNNQEIAVWIGIKVSSGNTVLPATGSSSLPLMVVALWTLMGGLVVTSRQRASSTMKGLLLSKRKSTR